VGLRVQVTPLYGVWKILVLDPMLGWVDLPMILCRIFAHGFGCDGFRSMVLDGLACINMYCNIERNIMRNQAGSPGFVFHNSYACNFYTGLKSITRR